MALSAYSATPALALIHFKVEGHGGQIRAVVTGLARKRAALQIKMLMLSEFRENH